MVDLPPLFTTEPSLSMPLPVTPTPCGTLDGLSIVMVTLPAFALSVLLSNFSAPLGSAASLRFGEAPAPPELVVELPVDAGAGVLLVVEVVELLLLDPQPATPSATTPAATANVVFIDLPLSSPVPIYVEARLAVLRRRLRSSELDLAGHDALTCLRRRRLRAALDAEAVVVADDGGGGEVHVGAAARIDAEGARADPAAVVADAPELVEVVGAALEAADVEPDAGAGVGALELGERTRAGSRGRAAELGVVHLAGTPGRGARGARASAGNDDRRGDRGG